MKRAYRIFLLVEAALAMALFSCSDDDHHVGGRAHDLVIAGGRVMDPFTGVVVLDYGIIILDTYPGRPIRRTWEAPGY